MLERALRIKPALDSYYKLFWGKMRIRSDEWRQITYLLHITKPFFMFTTALCKTKDITIYSVFNVYNALFQHIESSITKLQQKKLLWKQDMLEALQVAESKLREYYSQTIDPALGSIYAHGTILTPQYKLQFFQSEEWEDETVDYTEVYRSSLQDLIRSYQQDDPISSPQARRYTAIELAVQSMMPSKASILPTQADELGDYLQAGPINEEPCNFWRNNQTKYPTLARIARDLFSIPATGAGVERLFNTARDICHYRRGRLSTSTIKDLMVYNRTIKFDMDTEELSQLVEALKIKEEAGSKDSETRVILKDISDIEDLDLDSSGEEEQLGPIQQPQKRIREDLSEDSSDKRLNSSDKRSDDGELPSIRVSGRARAARQRQDKAEYAYY
ncbi:uncharacterized protein N7503_001218 [Penicillium pulvis]|uniref:uncharacterized protein n=1 Tax=Penicillium pulvis TaxID=1562058 RepID=UPI0025484E4D|nr:uncharacterized protein N7503_001218 [Penicillium pulvis]KAJ5814468.1 hypothetical protein N7503_001218 [Penicillium pulvis]